MQEEAATLQCPCGYAILCVVRSLMERLGAAVFFDDESKSETYGERIESCPGCGEQLKFLSLVLSNRRR